jgi:predicted membrane protein
MLATDFVALGALVLLLGVQVLLHPAFEGRRFAPDRRQVIMRRTTIVVWAVGAFAIFAIASWWSVLQYEAWRASELTRPFLPPYRDIGYYLHTIMTNFYGAWLIALGAGCLAWFALAQLNVRFGERFFEREEYLFCAASVFFSGYPGFLLFALIMMGLGLALTGVSAYRGRGRAPLYAAWFPAAILAILIEHWLIPQPFLRVFTF